MPQRLVTQSGRRIDVHSLGTKVAHVDDFTSQGYIIKHQYHSKGKISPLPYTIYWLNPEKASTLARTPDARFPDPEELIYLDNIPAILEAPHTLDTSTLESKMLILRRMRELHLPVLNTWVVSVRHYVILSLLPEQLEDFQGLLKEFKPKEEK